MPPSASASLLRMNGNGRFWPDEMRDVSNAARGGVSAPIRKVEIGPQDRVPVFRGEISALRHVGLDQAHPDAGHGRARRRGQPPCPEARDERKRKRCGDRRRERGTALSAAPQRRRRGENRDRQEVEPVEPDKARRLAPTSDWRRAPCRSRSRESRSGEDRAPIRWRPVRRRARQFAAGSTTTEAVRARSRAPETARDPPATQERRSAAPRRICPPRRETPNRPTKVRRENSRSPSTSRRRTRRRVPANGERASPRRKAPSISQTATVIGTAMRPTQREGRQRQRADRPGDASDRAPAPPRGQSDHGRRASRKEARRRKARPAAASTHRSASMTLICRLASRRIPGDWFPPSG